MKRSPIWLFCVILANVFTLSRVFLVPWGLFLYSTGGIWAGIYVVEFGFATDFFDGAVAKGMKCCTTFGKIADPIADIIAIAEAEIYFVLFAPGFNLPSRVLLAVLYTAILARNCLSQYVKWQGRKNENKEAATSSWMGKTSTALQMTAIGFYFMVTNVLEDLNWMPLYFIATFVAFGFSMYSGLDYGRKGWKLLRSPSTSSTN